MMDNFLHHINNAGIRSPQPAEEEKLWSILQQVSDPEIPVLSITDLGIVREVKISGSEVASVRDEKELEIIITPTYSGCPAMEAITRSIKSVLLQHGYKNVKITTALSPAWTTDWMSEAGKQKLKAYGIAPPNPKQVVCDTAAFQHDEAIQCPRCNSYHTKMISRFGSTPCKALYRCEDCREPFDYFKCH